MRVFQASNPEITISEIIHSANVDGVLIESQGAPTHAILPLDDDLLDHLIEHHPAFIAECEQIRQRMRAGESHSHEAVRNMFVDGDN